MPIIKKILCAFHKKTDGKEQTSSLGTLGKLPPEIRCLIWRYVTYNFPLRILNPKQRKSLKASIISSIRWFRSQPIQFPILLVSRQISIEAKHELHNQDYDLYLCLSPEKLFSDMKWTVHLDGEYTTSEVKWDVLEYSLTRTNFARFKSITLVIERPNWDPSHMLYARQITRLCQMFNIPHFVGEHGLRELRVMFVDRGGEQRWTRKECVECLRSNGIGLTAIGGIARSLENMRGGFKWVRIIKPLLFSLGSDLEPPDYSMSPETRNADTKIDH